VVVHFDGLDISDSLPLLAITMEKEDGMRVQLIAVGFFGFARSTPVSY
jgi:hypothetical protein